MAKEVTPKDLKAAVELKLKGRSSAWVLENFTTASGEKLSHSQFEFAFLRSATVEQGGMKELVGTVPATASNVQAQREKGESWGRIAVLIDRPEATARKLFAEKGTKSQGLRIGKGGRWLYNDQELYTDGLEQTGTEIPVGTNHEGARLAAADQKMIHMELDDLKAMATRLGIATTGSKAQIVVRIRKAMTPKAEKATKATKKVAKVAEAATEPEAIEETATA